MVLISNVIIAMVHFQIVMFKFIMFDKNVLCHGHDAIHFDVSNQAFFYI
jgi:hypothetical protein